jgi:hypothetical protein
MKASGACALALILGCQSPRAEDGVPAALFAADARSAFEREVGKEFPVYPCPIFNACKVLRRLPIGNRTKARFGIYRRGGEIVCNNVAVDCDRPGRRGFVVETTEECGLWQNYYVSIDHRIHLLEPRSIGQNGGAGFRLSEVEAADEATFSVLGLGFSRDQEHIYTLGGVLSQPDPSTFVVVDCSAQPDRSYAACDRRRLYKASDLQ